MLALAFAENEYQITPECLSYKYNAIHHINQKLGDALTPSVSQIFGAILLLIGVEVGISVSKIDH
jgi:hypothetical protein